MKLSNRSYDILKWIALAVIPASATLILTVGKIWGLPYYDNIAATITALGVFIAAIIGVSTSAYRTDIQTTFNTDDEMLEVDYEDTDDTAEKQ